MFSVSVATAEFTSSLREYQKLTKKALKDVLREQAVLLAQRLVKLTPPFSASQGKKAVARDIGRVYLKSTWWDIFSFTKQKLGERVKALVRARDTGALEKLFERSPKLRLIHIESFDPSRHQKMRRNGKVLVPDPRSFPVSEQSKVNAYINQKKRAVGMAKAGWAAAAAQLGKSAPSWLTKPGTGGATEALDSGSPEVVLINRVPYFAALDSKANIVARALEGRAKDMEKSAEHQMRLAAKAARFD